MDKATIHLHKAKKYDIRMKKVIIFYFNLLVQMLYDNMLSHIIGSLIQLAYFRGQTRSKIRILIKFTCPLSFKIIYHHIKVQILSKKLPE